MQEEDAFVIVGVIDNGELCAVLSSRDGNRRIEIERIIDCEVRSGFSTNFEIREYEKEDGTFNRIKTYYWERFNVTEAIASIITSNSFEVEYVA